MKPQLFLKLMHVSVREVCIPSEPDSAYFLRVAWKGRGLESGFQLLLTDGQDAWRGDVSEASVCAEAEELEMQMERYADPDPAEALRELLTHSLQRGNHLKEENQNLKEENLKMRGEHQRISAELKRYAGGTEQQCRQSADEEEDEYGGQPMKRATGSEEDPPSLLDSRCLHCQ
ncbi:hypothetical protein F7725_014999 [Dissostichus mawsoni]|uniref:XRCC4 N-terminal domain-containing protein n=1 Tax=Dissostichus mawsoni TaxID=36200 RepID=A0A7J5YG88_DISMA|nr:hypothetical protein F7725_014999 [Dissostichus mawsoni]